MRQHDLTNKKTTYLHTNLPTYLSIYLSERTPFRSDPRDYIGEELIGPKLFWFEAYPAYASSKLCEFIPWGGWVGGDYGPWISDPRLGTVLWPPTINLRTVTSHQEGWFQRKVSLHSHMCTGKFTQTGATLTVFLSRVPGMKHPWLQYSRLIHKNLGEVP